MDVLEQPADTEQADAPEGQVPPEAEQVRTVIVPPPIQYNAAKPPQAPAGPNCPVILVFAQAGWSAQLPFDQNAALDLAAKIRRAVKDARSGLTVQRAPLLGANGQPIAVPTAIADDLDDLDDEPSEPEIENEATV